MWAYIDTRWRLAAIVTLALAVAVALVADQHALTVLANGFGWNSPESTAPATDVVANGFGWTPPVPVDPGMPA